VAPGHLNLIAYLRVVSEVNTQLQRAALTEADPSPAATPPPGRGKFFFTVTRSPSSNETSLISARWPGSPAPRAAAAAGPAFMDPGELAAATARLARGESVTRIANALKVSRATLYRHTDITTARGHSG
jgi:hypothetical protein